MNEIEISAVFYQEGEFWIAQGLEYDITAQAPSLPQVYKKFAAKVLADVAISIDIGEDPLAGVKAAPEEFWQMLDRPPA